MKPDQPSPIKRDILLRVRILYLLFIAAGLCIFGRIVWVQFFSREVADNAERLHSRIFIKEELKARRGNILARNGEPLATSIFRYQVAFDFGSEGLDSLNTFNEQADSLAKLLSAYFNDRSAAEYARFFRTQHAAHYRLVRPRDTLIARSEGWLGRWLDRLRGREFERHTVYDTIRDHRPVNIFPREIDYAEWETLRTWPLLNWNMGMVYQLIDTDQRIYPQGDLARRTIGLIGNQGNYGIENAYREELTGTDGEALRQRIARRFSGRVSGSGYRQPVDGMDIVTTLDPDLQDVADRVLRNQLAAQNAIWGTTLVMEVQTGEILAIANLGRNADGSYSERENYALSQSIEPGSTFKLATILTLLEDAHLSPEATYDTHNGDRVRVGPTDVKDDHRGDREIALRQAVAKSSNVYFAKAMWELYGATGKKQQYSDFLHNQLHLGQTVGLERLGERPPVITTDWKVPDPGVMLVKMAYGYRVQLTPVQMLTFYNAIANGGRMVAPLLIRSFQRDGRVQERFETRSIAPSICSRSTLRIVQECLEAVCTEGTARGQFKDTTRLRVAAKTGTAQITDPRYQSCYLGSMVAYFPADNPRYTILTSIETQMQAGKTYYGAGLAGPVVSRLVDFIYNREQRPYETADRTKHYPERIKGGDIARIRRVAGKLSPDTESDARRGWGRAEVDSQARVTIQSLPAGAAQMPDVRGMGLKDALFLLERRGLRVRFSGAGAVTRQSIAAGQTVHPGQTVTLELH